MALLFSLPGTPVIYYGDEIGMGDNIYLGDRNGVRTPMQWSADRNAGFSRANPQRLYLPIIIDPEYHYEAVNVEVEQNNPSSPLWWMKRLIDLRKRFRRSAAEASRFLHPDNRKVLAFVRSHEDETVLVVANLSRFAQHVELDLAGFGGLVPVEIFGRNEFPPMGTGCYPLTLGPHAFYWFALEKARAAAPPTPASEELPSFAVAGPWESVFHGSVRILLEEALPRYLRRRKWFGGNARKIRSTKILEAAPMPGDPSRSHWTLLRVDYVDGEPETYLIPIGFAAGEKAAAVRREAPQAILAEIHPGGDGGSAEPEGVLLDLIYDADFGSALLEGISRRRRWKGERGEFAAIRTPAFRRLHRHGARLPYSVLKAEQTNSSVVYGDRFIAKLIRHPEEGTNPDLEVGLFLTERVGFSHAPPVAGAIEFRRRGVEEPMTLAILEGFVANQGDAWAYTLDALGRFFERMLGKGSEFPQPPVPRGRPLDLAASDPPAHVPRLVGSYLQSAQLLGCRTAELHLALASEREDPDFAPEPFSMLYQRSLYQSLRSLASQNLQLLRKLLPDLDADSRRRAEEVLQREEEIATRLRALSSRKIDALRIRIHGDFHLGQALYTGKDFVLIDFEGEPARTLSARRLKRSALVDVAGMLRSFDYAASAVLMGRAETAPLRSEDREALRPWALFWERWVAGAFLRAYLEKAREGEFLPRDRTQLALLLQACLLEKAIYEIGYEVQNRPDWVGVALTGVLKILARGEPVSEGGNEP